MIREGGIELDRPCDMTVIGVKDRGHAGRLKLSAYIIDSLDSPANIDN